MYRTTSLLRFVSVIYGPVSAWRSLVDSNEKWWVCPKRRCVFVRLPTHVSASRSIQPLWRRRNQPTSWSKCVPCVYKCFINSSPRSARLYRSSSGSIGYSSRLQYSENSSLGLQVGVTVRHNILYTSQLKVATWLVESASRVWIIYRHPASING